jgi:hypothetical protein
LHVREQLRGERWCGENGRYQWQGQGLVSLHMREQRRGERWCGENGRYQWRGQGRVRLNVRAAVWRAVVR